MLLQRIDTTAVAFNSRKKQFVNPIKIEVTRWARIETILGEAPAIVNRHQPPRAVYPYICVCVFV